MQKITIKTRVLTPVWTGNSEMVPTGLKMSGIIGSMRNIFEGLIRREGGHTCNINEEGKRCNYEKDKHICPACAVFGCTSWARTFKINWDLQPFNKTGTIVLPETDDCSRYRNRHADESVYPGKTSIDTWLATVVKEGRGTIRPDAHNEARMALTRMNPAYSADPKTKRRTDSNLEILVLREHPAYDIGKLIAGLISYMADYYAIGAKVNQGWGFFNALEGGVDEEDLTAELKKLIDAASSFSHPEWDKDLMNAVDIPYLEPIEVNMPNLWEQFSWNKAVSLNRYPYDFVSLGFALQYRLRRIVKFWSMDYQDSDPDCYFDLLGEDGIIDDWAKKHAGEIRNYQPQHRLSWQKEGAFSEYLFGKSNGNDKQAGRIGISHPWLDEDGKWYVRMISTAEWDYTEPLYEILKDQVN